MQNTIKKIILILTITILIGGISFGFIFYQNSQKTIQTNGGDVTNTDPTRTPFQTRISTSTNNTTVTEEEVEPAINPETPITIKKTRLSQLWSEPVSGFDFVFKDIEVVSTSTNNSSTSTIKNIQNKKVLKDQLYIYLWDRKTGHIYENLASTTDLIKISNYTLPGAQEVFFGDNSNVIVRSLNDDNETIKTQYIKLNKEFSSSRIYNTEIKDININSTNFAFSSNAKRLFYFIKNTGKGVISNFDGSVKTNAISTTLSELLPQYVNKDLIGLNTKPSAYFKGYLFTLNTNGTGKNSYILGEKYGLNTLISPDGNKVIYSEILNDTLETFIYDVKTKSSIYLSQATLTDKCVWSSDSKQILCAIPQRLYLAPYPEAWYKNEVSFSDNIWSINPENGSFKIVVPLQDQVATPIDVYKMQISNNGKYLIFQDKNTLTLWKYYLLLD